MNVTCSSCNTQYKIDATKVPPTGGFIKCKTCGDRVRIPPPGDIPLAGSDAPAQPPQQLEDAGTAPPAPPAPGGPIALAGSDAPAAPTPLAGPPATPSAPPDGAEATPGGPIPLAGSDAPTPPTPLAGPPATPSAPPDGPGDAHAPAPGGPIPLAGTDAPAPEGPNPLAGADTPTPGSPIPLAGSDTPTPGSPIPVARSPSGTADAPSAPPTPGAIPLADSDTPVAPTPGSVETPSAPPTLGAIPLAGSDAADAPAPGGPIPLGGSDAPAAPTPLAGPPATPSAPPDGPGGSDAPAAPTPLAGPPATPSAPPDGPGGSDAPVPPAPGGPIPLVGSDAPAPPAPMPLAGTPTPSDPPDGTIPLAGSDAPAPPAPGGPISPDRPGAPIAPPAPEGTTDGSQGPIPLAGSDSPIGPPELPDVPIAPPAPPASGAIPLAGSDAVNDDAPTVVTGGAIPLGGTGDDTTVVAATPSLPRSGDAIPLAGTPDDDTTAVAAPPEDAPTQVSEPPRFLDNVPASADPLDDLPAALPPDDSGATAPATPAPANEGASLFDDLPASTGGEPPALDLPTESTAPAFDDLPAADSGPLSLMDDLPAADSSAPSLMDDLPAADSSAPSLMDDLPAADSGAPSLMDDLPMADASEVEDLPVADADVVDLGEAPSLMDDLSAPQLGADAGSAPAVHPAQLGIPPAEAEETAAEAAPPARSKTRLIAIAGGGVALALLALMALTTPYLGVQIADPFGLAVPTPQPEPEPAPLAKAETKAETQAKTKAKAKPPEPEPEPERVELSADNVDSLGYATLRDSTAELAASGDADPGLLAWARFRLAAIYGDEDAKAALSESVPKRPKEITRLQGLAAPAAVGAMALTGKTGPARRIGERMQRGALKESPQLALALSTTYTKRPETPKALRQLDRAHKLAPELPDATLRRGLLLLGGKDPATGAKTLTQLVAHDTDPDLAVLVAGSLLDAGKPARLASVTAAINRPEVIERVAPARRDLAWRLLTYRAIHEGDLATAVEHAKERVAATSDLSARIELARLTAASGGDANEVFSAATPEKLDPADAARIVAERVRLALARDDAKAARAALQQGRSIPARKSGGWLKLAEGWLARHEQKAGAAKQAFNAAARARLPEARVEVALLADEPKARLKKLTELDKKTGLPTAAYSLAQVMEQRGNLRGAAELLGRVLWTDPTIINPIDLVLEWAEMLARSGQPEGATKVITQMREHRPDDVRPVRALAEIKRRAGAHDEVVELYRTLVQAHPKDASLKVDLAAAHNRADQYSQAQGILEEMLETDKAARAPAALMELARAWAEREPYRARQLVKESIEAEPTAEKYELLGRLAIKRDQLDEARQAYEKALQLDSGFVAARLALARIDLEARAFKEVVAGLEKVLEQEPRHREAAATLGDVYLEMNKPREAIKRFEIALSVREDEAMLLKVARLQLQRLGQIGPAIRTLRRLLAENPKLAEAHFHLGMALKDEGQLRDAAASFEQCLALEPEGPWATEAKTMLQDLQSR